MGQKTHKIKSILIAAEQEFDKTFEDLWQGIFRRRTPLEIERNVRKLFIKQRNYKFVAKDGFIELGRTGIFTVYSPMPKVVVKEWARHLFINNRGLFIEALENGLFSDPDILFRDFKISEQYQNIGQERRL